MIRIDIESATYEIVSTIISAIVGMGAGNITGFYCQQAIDHQASLGKGTTMVQLGKMGLMSAVAIGANEATKENLKTAANRYNSFADWSNARNAKKETSAEYVSEPAYVNVED